MKKVFYPLGLVTLLGFAMLFFTFSRDEMVQIDTKMTNILGDNAFITAFHYLGEPVFVVGVMLILLAYLWGRSKNYRGMLFVLFSVGVGNVLNQVFKKWIQRARPDVPHQLESFSFPSGHAMLGLLYVFTIAYFLTEYQSDKKVRILIWIGAVVLAALIGLSRIAEHRHFASDVFAGWMLGYTWFVIVAFWYEYRKRSFRPIK